MREYAETGKVSSIQAIREALSQCAEQGEILSVADAGFVLMIELQSVLRDAVLSIRSLK
jgi:hypothetical protein